MLRSAVRVTRTQFSPSSSRGLVTNLLEQLSLSQLKNEAKRHGLSPSGNKTSLITRIQHVESRQNSSTSINGRDSSTIKRGQATAGGSAPPVTDPRPTLDVKLPDLSAPQELPGPHIPFVPDFWDSSRARSADAIHHNADSQAPMRKVLVVAGAATHHAGGPSFGPSHHSESEEDHGVHQPTMSKTGFWTDVATDLGIPESFDASASLIKARDAVSSVAQGVFVQPEKKQQPSFHSRPLNSDEARGVWVLLIIFGGSWLAGGFFGKPKKKDDLSKR